MAILTFYCLTRPKKESPEPHSSPSLPPPILAFSSRPQRFHKARVQLFCQGKYLNEEHQRPKYLVEHKFAVSRFKESPRVQEIVQPEKWLIESSVPPP